MQSIRKDSVEIILNDELWELFTLQAEIEAMRRCGRNYAPTLDEMREEIRCLEPVISRAPTEFLASA